MIIPFNLPLTMTKGITFGPITFHFKNADLTPFDFTNGGVWKVFAYARKTHNATYKVDLRAAITDAAGGDAQIPKWTDEETLAVMGGEYGWDFVIETPTGDRIGPYFAGPFNVKEVYTHAG